MRHLGCSTKREMQSRAQPSFATELPIGSVLKTTFLATVVEPGSLGGPLTASHPQ